jgi:hypothetical protein
MVVSHFGNRGSGVVHLPRNSSAQSRRRGIRDLDKFLIREHPALTFMAGGIDEIPDGAVGGGIPLHRDQ